MRYPQQVRDSLVLVIGGGDTTWSVQSEQEEILMYIESRVGSRRGISNLTHGFQHGLWFLAKMVETRIPSTISRFDTIYFYVVFVSFFN